MALTSEMAPNSAAADQLKTPGLRLFLGLLGVFLVLAVPSLLKGGLYIGQHEGDTLHLLDITFRMAAGQTPHVDFMTPIGAWAFSPIAAFLKMGFGIGHALIYAQVAVAAALMPAIWWTAQSRFAGIFSYLFGALVLMFCLALVHGTAQSTVSISMHYNRWAWAIAFIAIALAVLPAKTRFSNVDAVLIAAMMFALGMIKVTYFVAFAPAVIVGLVRHGGLRALLVALSVGILAMAVRTGLYGFDYWMRYIGDLAAVSGSEVRAAPGHGFDAILASPNYLGASFAALAGVIFLRQGRKATEGLLLLLLLPGFWYVTYQNFGNDSQWLPLVALMLMMARPAVDVVSGLGWNMRQAITMTALATFCFGLPSVLNLVYSPLRHFGKEAENFTPILPNRPEHADLLALEIRMNQLDARVGFDTPDSGLPVYSEREDTSKWRGADLPVCEMELGMSAWFATVAEDLNANGFAGSGIFTADLLGGLWIYGNFRPITGAAPWYYGGLPGLKDADYVLIPQCPTSMDIRAQVIETLEETKVPLELARETPLYILERVAR
ncbi:MAG: hypothetical protein AAGD04_09345 [Pseudomonadota bacterium]